MASSCTWAQGGAATAFSVRKVPVPVGPAAGIPATSPGKTSTETPFAPSACCTPTRSRRGSCAGVETISHQLLQSVNTRSGWVSWKKPVPIWPDGMCEARASTGRPLRWASYRPWMRWVLPGPQEPAQTASRPLSSASAAAANAPASSLRTCTQLMPSVRRIASTTGLRLSPTTP